jgi:hypothetical protein
MSITSVDQLVSALGNGASRMVIDKASIANQLAAGYSSLWRATGVPGQGVIPGAAALCTKALLGAVSFTNQTSPTTSYLAWAFLTSSLSANTIELHDRLAHIGGLSLNVNTLQAASLNLETLLLPAARRGDANYSDVQWWLEVYADGGATASNATVNVTYDDGSTGNLAVIAVGGTLRASRMLPLIPLIPGRFIKAINSVTLSALTGTVGNFGFTATRPRSVIELPLANKAEVRTWDQLGMPELPNDACIFFIMLCPSTATGTLRGGGKIAHG